MIGSANVTSFGGGGVGHSTPGSIITTIAAAQHLHNSITTSTSNNALNTSIATVASTAAPSTSNNSEMTGNVSADKLDFLEFPLIWVRRCGHSSNLFILELGRSSIIGSGDLWLQPEDCDTAQYMHEVVVASMRTSKEKDDFRGRSSSSSESGRPWSSRRKFDPPSVSRAQLIESQLANSHSPLASPNDAKPLPSTPIACNPPSSTLGNHNAITTPTSNKFVVPNNISTAIAPPVTISTSVGYGFSNAASGSDALSGNNYFGTPASPSVSYSSLAYTLPSASKPSCIQTQSTGSQSAASTPLSSVSGPINPLLASGIHSNQSLHSLGHCCTGTLDSCSPCCCSPSAFGAAIIASGSIAGIGGRAHPHDHLTYALNGIPMRQRCDSLPARCRSTSEGSSVPPSAHVLSSSAAAASSALVNAINPTTAIVHHNRSNGSIAMNTGNNISSAGIAVSSATNNGDSMHSHAHVHHHHHHHTIGSHNSNEALRMNAANSYMCRNYSYSPPSHVNPLR